MCVCVCVCVHVCVCVCVCVFTLASFPGHRSYLTAVEKEKIDFSPQLRGSTAARLNLGGAWE